jgi:ubiquinone/menaquinone biosynthesis C-methylase UbiE
MLRRGAANLVREGIVGVTLARANVERLPFADESFDGAICCGSLHLFPDPLLALKEIRRAMRPGAPLAVQTFLMRRKPGSEGLKDRIGYHQYEVEELRSRLEGAGFAGISIRAVGTVLLASAARPGGRA